MIGQRLSHYEVIAKIGAGGMGEVYRARDTRLEREVAFKVLPEEMASNPMRLSRFQREAKTVAALNHPNIVTIHSVEEAEGVHFLTMELVTGKALDELLPSDGFPLDRFLALATPIADAVASAHTRGIVHRDLKPANVMVTDEGDRVKVLDFGLAKLSAADDLDGSSQLMTMTMTQEGLIVGTPYYMSPEQARGEAVDHRSDIFSLGVMFFEMVTGHRPFEGATAIELMSAILKDPAPALSDVRPEVPRHLGSVIGRCLEKAPEDRHQTALDVYNKLRDLELEASAVPPQAPRVGKPAVGRATLQSTPAGAGLRKAGIDVSDDVGETMRKLAVLPLLDHSPDSDQDWFAAGVHEALLRALQQIDGLQVTSRTSVLRYRGTDKLLPEIGSELGVEYLVEGSVARVGDRIRVSAQLVDASTDHQVWSGEYERDVRDVLALQSEVARTISGAIHVVLTPEAEARLSANPQVDPDTYEQYVRGLQHFDRVTKAGFRKSVEFFEQAIASDPEFAPAHAALAIAYGIAAEYGWISREQAAPRAVRAADQALHLAPKSGDAHHAQAGVAFHMDRDFAKAEERYRKALELSSSAYIYFGYGWLLSQMGRHHEAVDALERAVELDPRSPLMHGDLGWWLYGARHFERAVEEARIAIDLDPQQPESYWLLAAAQSQQGEFTRALDAFTRYEELSGDAVPSFRGYLLALAGQHDAAVSALEELEKRIKRGESQRIEAAQIHLGLGNDEKTLEVLEEAAEANVSFQPYLWPEYERLFGEPRFAHILERLRYPKPSRTTQALP